MSTQTEVASLFDTLSIEEQVGQLFILAFPGKNSHTLAEIIETYGVAGCYISQDNAETFAEAIQLTQALDVLVAKTKIRLPLILGVDQEGAWGTLIPEATIGPGNLALGLTENTEHTAMMYGIFAKEMGAVGYQAILGPCADINLNPRNPIIGTRSFGEKAIVVAKHVATAVKAINTQGVLSTAKHFPGHGDTYVDTHRDIPTVDKSLETLLQQELLPFQAAIDAGVDMIMTAHMLFPQLDADVPATLSEKILSDLLRKKMNFKGLVITDSMNMGAIRKYYEPHQASLQAFLAGANLIMLSEEHYDHDDAYLERQIQAIESIVKAVKDGKIAKDVLKEKVCRVIQKRMQLHQAREEKKAKVYDTSNIQGEQFALHKKEELRIARSSVRIIRDENALVSVLQDNMQERSIAVLNCTPLTSYGNSVNVRGIGPNQRKSAFDTFSETFLQYRPHSTVLSYEDAYENVHRSNEMVSYDIIIAVTEDYPLPGEDFAKEEQQALVQKLVAHYNDSLMIIGLRSAYELMQYHNAKCYICAYSSRTCSAKAMADMLFSKK